MRKLLFMLMLLVASQSALALYVDMSLNYSFNRRVFVDSNIENEDQNKAIATTEGYSVIWAWYIIEYTALEFSFSQSKDRLQDDRPTATNNNSVIINSVDSTVYTQVQGVGLRQAFAGRNSRIIPSLSLGYAKLVTSGTTNYKLDVNGDEEEISLEKDTVETTSSYAMISVRIRFTELLGLTLAAKTVVPEFDTKQAANNLTYQAGLSWIF